MIARIKSSFVPDGARNDINLMKCLLLYRPKRSVILREFRL